MKLSIIIPVYNRPDLLSKTLDSVRGIFDSEIIVVDDGSAKKNALLQMKICKDFGAIYIIKSNSGVSEARKAGLKYAKGNFIFFLDSDDLVTIEMKNFLNSKNDFNEIERFNEIHCSSRGEKMLNLFPLSRKTMSKSDLFNSYQISSYILSSSIANELDYYGTWGEDHHFLSDLLEISKYKYWKVNKLPSIKYKANENHLNDEGKFMDRLNEFLNFSKSKNWHLANRFWLLVREANRFKIRDKKFANFVNYKYQETLKFGVFKKLPIYMKFIWLWRFLKFWDRKIIKSSN